MNREEHIELARQSIERASKLWEQDHDAEAVERLLLAGEHAVDALVDDYGLTLEEGNIHQARAQAACDLHRRGVLTADHSVLLRNLDKDRVGTQRYGNQSRFDDARFAHAHDEVTQLVEESATRRDAATHGERSGAREELTETAELSAAGDPLTAAYEEAAGAARRQAEWEHERAVSEQKRLANVAAATDRFTAIMRRYGCPGAKEVNYYEKNWRGKRVFRVGMGWTLDRARVAYSPAEGEARLLTSGEFVLGEHRGPVNRLPQEATVRLAHAADGIIASLGDLLFQHGLRPDGSARDPRSDMHSSRAPALRWRRIELATAPVHRNGRRLVAWSILIVVAGFFVHAVLDIGIALLVVTVLVLIVHGFASGMAGPSNS